jgi:hypothetical protein
MGGFWPRIYVVKKGHARYIYFLLQTRSFWRVSAPSSLFLCADICYRWMPHNASFGFLDIAGPALGRIYFWGWF